MVRLIELTNLDSQFAVDDSYFPPPALAHKTDMVLSLVTHKMNARNRNRCGVIVLDLILIRSSLFSASKVKVRFLGPCLAFNYLIRA